MIDELKGRLDQHPEIKYQIEEDSITAFPKDDTGFSVRLVITPRGFRVYYQNWYEDFDNGDEALGCFMYGLTNKCRLKVIAAGNLECRWILEYHLGEEWVEECETSLLLYPFWRRKKISYYRNNFITG